MEPMSIHHFGDRLAAAVKQKKTPLVVGLDPRWERLPKAIREQELAMSSPCRAAAYEKFCCQIIDVVADKVPAVKPQAAFFEQLGPAGMQAMFNVVRHAESAGLIVIMDAKRGDIGSTAEAYASAFLDRSEGGSGNAGGAWRCDSLTVNPYLGDDSLTPFVKVANEHGGGIFVLAKTSNPGGKTFQEQPIDGQDAKLFELVADHLQSLALASAGESGYGNVGAVVGATYPQELEQLRQRMPNAWFLIPGFGAQGGSASDVAGGFDQNGLGGLVNSSRGIIFAYEKPEFESIDDWVYSIAHATDAAIVSIAESTPAGNLR
jgi:orotidine-5'-phosphate decarboxylase